MWFKISKLWNEMADYTTFRIMVVDGGIGQEGEANLDLWLKIPNLPRTSRSIKRLWRSFMHHYRPRWPLIFPLSFFLSILPVLHRDWVIHYLVLWPKNSKRLHIIHDSNQITIAKSAWFAAWLLRIIKFEFYFELLPRDHLDRKYSWSWIQAVLFCRPGDVD